MTDNHTQPELFVFEQCLVLYDQLRSVCYGHAGMYTEYMHNFVRDVFFKPRLAKTGLFPVQTQPFLLGKGFSWSFVAVADVNEENYLSYLHHHHSIILRRRLWYAEYRQEAIHMLNIVNLAFSLCLASPEQFASQKRKLSKQIKQQQLGEFQIGTRVGAVLGIQTRLLDWFRQTKEPLNLNETQALMLQCLIEINQGYIDTLAREYVLTPPQYPLFDAKWFEWQYLEKRFQSLKTYRIQGKCYYKTKDVQLQLHQFFWEDFKQQIKPQHFAAAEDFYSSMGRINHFRSTLLYDHNSRDLGSDMFYRLFMQMQGNQDNLTHTVKVAKQLGDWDRVCRLYLLELRPRLNALLISLAEHMGWQEISHDMIA